MFQLRHVRQLRAARCRVQTTCSAELRRREMIDGPVIERRSPAVATDVRERWRMGPEARGLLLVSAVLTAFGLAVLYSASAFVAMRQHDFSAYFLVKQLVGVAVGMAAFAI